MPNKPDPTGAVRDNKPAVSYNNPTGTVPGYNPSEAEVDAACEAYYGTAKLPHLARDMARALAAAASVRTEQTEGWRPTHRHKKGGGEYQLLGVGKMQVKRWFEGFWDEDGQVHAGGNVDMENVAVYRGMDGKLWVRPRGEFEDGSFEVLTNGEDR